MLPQHGGSARQDLGADCAGAELTCVDSMPAAWQGCLRLRSGQQRLEPARDPPRAARHGLLEAARAAPEALGGLPEDEACGAAVVVAEAQVVVQRREAVALALDLHRVELSHVELRLLDVAPVAARRVERHAGA